MANEGRAWFEDLIDGAVAAERERCHRIALEAVSEILDFHDVDHRSAKYAMLSAEAIGAGEERQRSVSELIVGIEDSKVAAEREEIAVWIDDCAEECWREGDHAYASYARDLAAGIRRGEHRPVKRPDQETTSPSTTSSGAAGKD